MCEKSYIQRQSLLRHIRNAHANLWTCAKCKNTYNREDNFHYHQRVCNGIAPVASNQAAVARSEVNLNRSQPTRTALNNTC